MDSLTASSSPPASDVILRALADARRILADAQSDALTLRRQVAGLADDTDWRARATAAYRAAMVELIDDVSRLAARIGASDDDLAVVQRAGADPFGFGVGAP